MKILKTIMQIHTNSMLIIDTSTLSLVDRGRGLGTRTLFHLSNKNNIHNKNKLEMKILKHVNWVKLYLSKLPMYMDIS